MQRVVWRSRSVASGVGSAAAIHTPNECDHSPVNLRSLRNKKGNRGGRWRGGSSGKGTGGRHHRGCNAAVDTEIEANTRKQHTEVVDEIYKIPIVSNVGGPLPHALEGERTGDAGGHERHPGQCGCLPPPLSTIVESADEAVRDDAGGLGGSTKDCHDGDGKYAEPCVRGTPLATIAEHADEEEGNAGDTGIDGPYGDDVGREDAGRVGGSTKDYHDGDGKYADPCVRSTPLATIAEHADEGESNAGNTGIDGPYGDDVGRETRDGDDAAVMAAMGFGCFGSKGR